MADSPTTLTLTASVVQEGDWYVAQCVEFDVASQGPSVAEALANLKTALELYFEGEPTPDLATKPIVALVEVRLSASP